MIWWALSASGFSNGSISPALLRGRGLPNRTWMINCAVNSPPAPHPAPATQFLKYETERQAESLIDLQLEKPTEIGSLAQRCVSPE